MKYAASIVGLLMLFSTLASGQQLDWQPTPLVIEITDKWQEHYGNDDIVIPFTTSGTPAQIWLVVETRHDDSNKPVSVRNGFMNWHYVNGIDTTVYVSAARTYSPGDHTWSWDGRGNEMGGAGVVDERGDTGHVRSGYYRYCLWGFDYESDRELACDFLPISAYEDGQYLRFYVYKPDGTLYPTPMLMGQLPYFQAEQSGYLGNASIFKWQLGNNPHDPSLLAVSSVPGYGPNEVYIHPEYDPVTNPTANYMVGYGPGIFDSQDHNIFYFTKNKYWEQSQTVVKYRFVPDGVAVQDTSWGDYSHVEWLYPGNKGDDTKRSSLIAWRDDFLVMLDPGMNPVTYPYDMIHVLDKVDPEVEYVHDSLEEFYMPEQPPNVDGEKRTVSEINRINYGYYPDTMIITGDMTCLTECIKISRLYDGASEPYAANGYVTWANSNGDFFLDMSSQPDPDYPEQHWACIVSDPKTPNNPRRETTNADMNGFTVAFIEFHGLNSFGVYCPDGSGIDIAKFYDDIYSTGTTNETRKGGGEILDYGGQYDGIYTMAPVYNLDTGMTLQTWYTAFDSDTGIIYIYWRGDAVEEDSAPAAFTLSQNSPNPFNPSTVISFSLPADSDVAIDIFNIAGQKVATVLDSHMSAGDHSAVWNAGDHAAGTYFYKVTAGELSKTKKMLLVK